MLEYNIAAKRSDTQTKNEALQNKEDLTLKYLKTADDLHKKGRITNKEYKLINDLLEKDQITKEDIALLKKLGLYELYIQIIRKLQEEELKKIGRQRQEDENKSIPQTQTNVTREIILRKIIEDMKKEKEDADRKSNENKDDGFWKSA